MPRRPGWPDGLPPSCAAVVRARHLPGLAQDRREFLTGPAGHGPGRAKHECNNFRQLSDFPAPSSAPILSAPASVMSAYRVAGG